MLERIWRIHLHDKVSLHENGRGQCAAGQGGQSGKGRIVNARFALMCAH
jgi:hypothetical protein